MNTSYPTIRRSLQLEALEPRNLLSATPLFPHWEPTPTRSVASAETALVQSTAPLVRIVATDAAAGETLSGQANDNGVFTISRTGTTSSALRVNYSISGTADNGIDYVSRSGTILIPSGQSATTLRIRPLDDALMEGTEEVTLTLTSRTAYRIDPLKAAATVALADNDVPDTRIADLVAEVQQSNSTTAVDSYEDFFTLLPINEGAQRGYDGSEPQEDLLTARSAIFSALETALLPAGGTVSYQDFTVGGYAGRNIVGILPGNGARSDQQYLITAHYDSVENAGADDNASGVAGLLEAARVLAGHDFDATLVFLATDQEEERDNGWGVGSRFYAQTASDDGVDLRGALVLDMIAYNHAGGNTAIVGQSNFSITSPSATLVGDIRQAFWLYTDIATTRETGFTETDAFRFRQSGFTVATLIEQLDSDGSLLNPYYHEPTDFYRDASGQLQQYNGQNYLDLAYATQMTRGTVAWAATAAGLL